jgi:pyruvate carboxylase
VLDDYFASVERFEDVSILDTPTYFYGLEVGQEVLVDLEPGKTLVISLSAVGDADEQGMRTVYFALNGQARFVRVRDRSRTSLLPERRLADPSDPSQLSASMPGLVVALHCKPGDALAAGAAVLTLEAMKMETVVRAPRAGRIKELVPGLKSTVQAGDLLAILAS